MPSKGIERLRQLVGQCAEDTHNEALMMQEYEQIPFVAHSSGTRIANETILLNQDQPHEDATLEKFALSDGKHCDY
jgi:hypothetical protein